MIKPVLVALTASFVGGTGEAQTSVTSGEQSADCASANLLRSAAAPCLSDVIIVTASGREAALADTAASVEVIDGAEVESIRAIRIGEVLAAAPGVFFSGLNGPREIAQVRQPLAFDNRTLFLEDGVPLQSSIFFDQSALGYSVALASPGGIEVLRGPGTALYGSDAFSGVVHVRSKAAPEAFEAGLRARAGEFGLFDLQAEVGGPISPSQRLRLTAAFSGEEGFRDETSFNRGQAIARHAYVGDVFEADSSFVFTRYETESATAISFDDFLAGSRASGLSPLVDPDEAVERGVYARAQSRLAWNASENIRIEATPYYRRQDIEATATFRPATVPRTSALVETAGLLPRLYWDHSPTASTIAGLDVELTWFDRLTVQDAPDTVVFGNLFRQGVQYDYAVSYRGLSPYLQHQRKAGPITLTFGVRYDNLRYDFTNALTEEPGDALFQVADRVDRFDALSPKAGVVWTLDERHSVFARYARGFRIPRESDLYELEVGQAEFVLEPERLDSGEIGWRADLGRAAFELIGYWSVSRDGVITDVQTAAGNISINAGSSRFAGVELSARADLGGGIFLDAAFAFQDFRFRRRAADGPDPFDGNLISEAPRTLGHLALTWRPTFYDNLSATARLRHIGPWALNDANTVFTDNEFILTLLADWQVTDRIALDLRVENVTDTLYPVFADAPAFRPNGRARPGQPRTLSGGVRITF
ncbi:MAG: TonB-dependent receptor [Pseudomonadota bacterium]